MALFIMILILLQCKSSTTLSVKSYEGNLSVVSCDLPIDYVKTWDRVYTIEGFQGVATFVMETSDRGYIAIGAPREMEFDFYDTITVLKTDFSGDVEWSLVYTAYLNVLANRSCFSLKETPDGYKMAFITGPTKVTVKTISQCGIETDSTTLQLSWMERVHALSVTGDEEILIAGKTGTDYVIVHYHEAQGIINTIYNDAYEKEWLCGIGKGRNGLYYYGVESVDGPPISFDVIPTNLAAWIVYLDPDGTEMWRTYTRTDWSEESFEGSMTVNETNAGGIIVSTRYGPYEQVCSQVTKLSPQGSIRSQKIFHDVCIGNIKQTKDYGYIFTGFKGDDVYNIDGLYIIKMDAFLNDIWSKLFETDDTYTIKAGYDIIETSDCGYAVAGEKSTGFSINDEFEFWLMKLGMCGQL